MSLIRGRGLGSGRAAPLASAVQGCDNPAAWLAHAGPRGQASVQRDYFAVLEIGPGASEQEIRAAYRRLARRYHPDLHPDRADGEQRLKELNAAYEVLGDATQRARYLRTRRVHVRVDVTASEAAPAAPRPPSPPPPPPFGYVVYGSHVDLSGGRRGRRAYGGAAPRPAVADDELAVLYARRLLRALFGW
jgi:curved DNA-binding protein CbpA